jgi:hypothetical protein
LSLIKGEGSRGRRRHQVLVLNIFLAGESSSTEPNDLTFLFRLVLFDSETRFGKPLRRPGVRSKVGLEIHVPLNNAHLV